MLGRRVFFSWFVALLSLVALVPREAHAQEQAASTEHRGRPTVILDRLELPDDVADAPRYERYLRRILKREARRATWGAGRGSRIEYRFKVTKLSLVMRGDVLTVSCSARGLLPGNKSARSSLSFGGDPRKPQQLVERVLEIVARGVITRLAEIERIRRGQLDSARVAPPAPSPPSD